LDAKQQRFLARIRAGDTISQACRIARIKRSTFIKWQGGANGFNAAYSEALDIRAALLTEDLYKEAKSGNAAARKAYLDALRAAKKQRSESDSLPLKLYAVAAPVEAV
jgi:hypothetical protein